VTVSVQRCALGQDAAAGHCLRLARAIYGRGVRIGETHSALSNGSADAMTCRICEPVLSHGLVL
jgi:hypothetical protein